MNLTIKIIPTDGKAAPAGKLADAELHFSDGVLAGLRLIGFAVWESRGGRRNVTFPARSYAVNGERRSFALLRPIGDASAQEAVRLAILDAYANDALREQAAQTFLATPQGPVSDRSMGTAADYGSRGDAPAPDDWKF
jgi:hypothetical protein